VSTQATDDVTATRRSYLAEIFVSLKPVVNDPQGLAIRDGLHALGYNGVESVRAGKYLRVTLESDSNESAHTEVAQMCDQLIANPVIETYEISITPLNDH
jgi:phosphoribosylformylglycinamidine synthase